MFFIVVVRKPLREQKGTEKLHTQYTPVHHCSKNGTGFTDDERGSDS